MTASSLRTRKQFQQVYTEGSKAVGRLMVVYALAQPVHDPQPSVPAIRVGIVASKKVGNAVRRNRAKRVLRASYRQLSGDIREAWWIVLIARTPLGNRAVRSQTATVEMKELLNRLGLQGDLSGGSMNSGETPGSLAEEHH